MDWSKATTILIIALLAVCLMLSGILVYRNQEAKKADAEAAMLAVEYLKTQGASAICDIPLERPSLPVLFIHFNPASTEHTNILENYKGYPVITGRSKTVQDMLPSENGAVEIRAFLPELTSVGNAKAKVISASSAVLNAATLADNIKGLEIRSVRLVYYIESDGFNPMLEDTSLPCWEVDTNRGTFYINAYAV